MPFQLPDLSYATDALAPIMSAETLEFHHGKHHKAYVDNLNKLVGEKGLEGAKLSDVVLAARSVARKACSTTPARSGTTASSGSA